MIIVFAEISFREMLPANAAVYFLQLVNSAVAGTALVMFMNRRNSNSPPEGRLSRL
jgi:hypothetical protein